MANDPSFIADFLAGAPHILDTIYTQSFPMVERYIVSHGGSRSDAEDVFQQSLLTLYVKLKEGNLEIQSFESYLFTVCRNLWRRENAKKRVTKLDDRPLVSEAIDQAAFYVEQEQYDLFVEKLKSLSQSCREILQRVFEGMSYKAIVAQFGYASQTVARQRVFKCKARLVQLIQKDTRYRRLTD